MRIDQHDAEMANETPKGEKIEIRHDAKVSYPVELPNAVKAKSHSFYIVQERDGTPINWKKPLIDSCQMTTDIKIATVPFSEGSFRYAF
jgi:hypothetical protein